MYFILGTQRISSLNAQQLIHYYNDSRRNKEEKKDGDSLRQATPHLQNPNNCKHRVDSEVLNPK
ncbi:hypothetical protein [Okeania sp. KiyG1]|uniref:hypothetical protein n=1 Tax=Okeania sp. KiyG1 TaxID=2720165 RepID=UPI0019208700|nr:hypothetical protein [Okeania sp. KiyG1]GGA27284.1 hypothetical protein CYANOKiyG1_43470 [Okeania sp. KiyG1]